jgi:hypothetical protein
MAAARWALERGVPLVYRVQDAPRDDGGPRRATYTLTPDPHHAMGGALYAHVTSPLRRFQDFLTHWQLKGWLHEGRAPLSTEDLLRRAGDDGLPPMRAGIEHGPAHRYQGALNGRAGTRAARVVAASWSVKDRQSALQMQIFYRELGRVGPAAALARAQRRARAGIEPPHPRFWAFYAVYGGW